MNELQNPLKEALRSGRLQVGLWCSLGSALVTEALAGSGYDWLLVDVEHSPNNLLSVLHQHQATSAYRTEIVVRLPSHDPNLMKQYLDVGVRSFLLPAVQSVEEASQIVSATRYPPLGTRGYSVATRANRFGRIKNYHPRAHDDIFLALQIESAAAASVARDIAQVDGVDAIFVGPGDLSADMGSLGNPHNEKVQETIRAVLSLGREGGIATGTLAPIEDDARRYMEWGARLVAVGSDLGLLTKAGDALAAKYLNPEPKPAKVGA